MANKTQPTETSVDSYFATITDEARRSDCKALVEIMTRATRQRPKMWGTSIVGFGVRHYRYESGREGDTCVVGFASRKGDISIYGLGESLRQKELAERLGRYKTGKGCVYVRRISDIDTTVLEQLVASAAAEKSPR